MRHYFISYVGDIPLELTDMIIYSSPYTKNCVIVATDKSMGELNKIKGVSFVERADTGRLCEV